MSIREILFIMGAGIVISSLDDYPLNKAVIAGQRTKLECKTNYNETVNRWTITRMGIRADVIFQNSGNQHKTHFDVRFLQNGDSILYLNRTERNDSGVYKCHKKKDEVQSSAQLIVLESNPVCESNLSAGFKALPHCIDIWMRCQVNFSTLGNWNPSMEWTQHHENAQLIRNDSASITTSSSVTSILHVSISSVENGSHFSCITFFKPYNGPVETTASNIPDFRFIWNSTKIIFQDSALSADNCFYSKDILMSSDGQTVTSVTTAVIDRIDADSDSTNYWFSVSLSLGALVSIFLVLIAIMALIFHIYRKRITAGVGDLFQEPSLSTMDQAMSGEYDIIPFSYNDDGYDNIADANETDFDVPIKVTLPTAGYDHLLGKRCSPSTYSPIDKSERPLDKEDAKKIPDQTPDCEQHLDASKLSAVNQSVEVNAKCIDYVEIIS